MKWLTTLMIMILSMRGQAVGPIPGPAASGPTAGSKVAQACRLSPYKKECMAQFGADPNNHKVKLKDLGVKALEHASQVGVDTSQFIQEQLKTADQMGPMVQQYLEDCSNMYIDAVEQLDDCTAGMSTNAYADVQTWLNAAVSDANLCESGFKMQPQSEELKAKNDQFLKAVENAKSVIKALGSPGK